MTSLAAAGYQRVVLKLRGWGDAVEVVDGAYDRNNGITNYKGPNGWPIGHCNHHFVCSLNPDEDYIRGLVRMLTVGYGELAGAGSVVPWFQDVHGKHWLIAAGPSNHSGKGSSILLMLRQSHRPPAGAADRVASDNDINGNAWYSGSEKQHPGDSTPWPTALIRATILLNAAECIEFADGDVGYCFDHYEHTNRKVDMSFEGGPDGQGAFDIRGAVQQVVTWDKNGGTGVPVFDANWNLINGDTPAPPAPPTDEMEEIMGYYKNKEAFEAAVRAQAAAGVNDALGVGMAPSAQTRFPSAGKRLQQIIWGYQLPNAVLSEKLKKPVTSGAAGMLAALYSRVLGR